mgnify:CR=1 FL=1
MSQKKIKSKTKKKQIRVLSKKNLIKKFFVILLFTFITSSISYFIINNKWLPKDKKLFKSLKDENIELFRLCKKVIETYEYKDLINVYKYIFI